MNHVDAQCDRYGLDRETIQAQTAQAQTARQHRNGGTCSCDFTGLPLVEANGHRINHEMFNRCYSVTVA